MATQQEIARLVITLEGQVKELKRSLNESTKDLTTFGSRTQSILNDLKAHWKGYTFAILGAIYALKKLATPFAEFSQKMYEVNTLINLSKESFEDLSQTILAITRRVPQSAGELAAALYDIISAGVAVEKSTNVLESSAKAAVAGVTDTKTAAGAGLAVINAYGKEIDSLGNVYDVLFQTVKDGVLTFSDLSASIGNVLPSARAAGVEFEDVAASIAVMTKAGINTSIATTSLRAGFVALAAPTDDARKNMEMMGITWKGWIPTLEQIKKKGLDLQGMRMIIPDERSSKAVLALTQNFDSLITTVDKMKNSTGAMETAYAIMRDSPVNQIKQLSNSVLELKIALVSAFAPAILWGARALTKEFQYIRMLTQGYSVDLIRLFGAINDVLPTIESSQAKMNYLFRLRQDVTNKINKLLIEQTQLEKDAATAHFYKLNAIQGKYETVTKKIEDLKKQSKLLGDELLKFTSTQITTEIKLDEEIPLSSPEKTATQLKAEAESLQVYNAEVTAALEELRQAFARNKIGIDAYFESQRLLIEDSYTEQLRVLNELIPKLKEEKDIKAVQEKVNVLLIEKQSALNKLKYEEISLVDEYDKKLESVNKLIYDQQKQLPKGTEITVSAEFTELLEQQRTQREAIIKEKLTEIDEKKALDRLYMVHKLQQERFIFENERQLSIKRQELARDSAGSIANSFDALYKTTGEKVKAFFFLSRAAALAEAIINMNLGMTKAQAQGGIWGGVYAATVAIAAGLNIANIAAQTIQGFESGGLINFGKVGRDQVPIRATKGEFVSRKSAVDYYGPSIMEALNRQAIPKELFNGYNNFSPRNSGRFFAEGGLVSETSNEDEEKILQINNIVDPSLMGQFLNTRPGQNVIMNIIRENAYQIRKTLRI